MKWLFGLAILPALLCGLMWLGGMGFAAVATRNSRTRRAIRDEPPITDVAGHPLESIRR